MRFPVPRLDIYDVPFRVVYQNFNNRFNSVRLLEVVFSASLQTRCSFERLALSVSRLTYRRCKLAAVLLRPLRGADPGRFAPPGCAMHAHAPGARNPASTKANSDFHKTRTVLQLYDGGVAHIPFAISQGCRGRGLVVTAIVPPLPLWHVGLAPGRFAPPSFAMSMRMLQVQ